MPKTYELFVTLHRCRAHGFSDQRCQFVIRAKCEVEARQTVIHRAMMQGYRVVRFISVKQVTKGVA